MTESKMFDFWVSINYKNGKVKTYSRKPKSVKPYEIPVHMKIKINLPEIKELVAQGEITMSETQLKDIVVSEL